MIQRLYIQMKRSVVTWLIVSNIVSSLQIENKGLTRAGHCMCLALVPCSRPPAPPPAPAPPPPAPSFLLAQTSWCSSRNSWKSSYTFTHSLFSHSWSSNSTYTCAIHRKTILNNNITNQKNHELELDYTCLQGHFTKCMLEQRQKRRRGVNEHVTKA